MKISLLLVNSQNFVGRPCTGGWEEKKIICRALGNDQERIINPLISSSFDPAHLLLVIICIFVVHPLRLMQVQDA